VALALGSIFIPDYAGSCIFFLSFDLFGMGGNCRNIQPFSSLLLHSPRPPRLSSTCSQFLFFFSFIISFFFVFGFYSCLLACCFAFNWKLILFTQEDNLTKHCFFSPVVLIPRSQRYRIWLSQSSFQETIPCHNTVYCVYMDSESLNNSFIFNAPCLPAYYKIFRDRA